MADYISVSLTIWNVILSIFQILASITQCTNNGKKKREVKQKTRTCERALSKLHLRIL